MSLQVLISTMYQTDYSLIKKMNIQSDVVVVNQCNKNNFREFRTDNFKIKWINSVERGLSRSRNIAIKYANNDFCLLADDDLEYVKDYESIILEQFQKYPEADVITFKVEGIEKKFKDYHTRSRKLNYLTSMKVASVEIAFRLESIKKAGISFNELFGAGAKYLMGEENIFLFECIKCGLNIIYVPVKIANLHILESTWFKGYDEEYFRSKGAAFTVMSRLFSFLFVIQFAIRKYKLFKKETTRLKALKYMLEGRKQYLEENKIVDESYTK